jgi:hypothetical protein
MAIQTNSPHPSADLTVNGSMRVEVGTEPTCTLTTAGTLKTVSQSNANQVCSCVCNGAKWQSVIDSMECNQQCCGADNTRNNNTCEVNCSATTLDGYSLPATKGGSTASSTKQEDITGGKQNKQKTFTCRDGAFLG